MLSFTKELAPGKYKINFGIYDIYLIDLSSIEIQSEDSKFLMSYAPTKRVEKINKTIQESGMSSKKLLDILKEMLYIRVTKFEDSTLRGKLMPALLEADITDIAKPYYDKRYTRR